MSKSTIPTLITARRLALLAAVSLLTAGCEAIANIFQAGFVVGIIAVLLILGVVLWLLRKASGGRRS